MSENKYLSLWKKVQSDDQEAFALIYSDFIDTLLNYGRQFSSNRGIIEDAIQDLFINLWNKRKQIIIHSSFKPYLFKSLRRLIMSKLQSQNLLESLESYHEVEIPDMEITADKMSKVKRAMHHLSKREHEAVYLKYFENLDYEEMSLVMNIDTKGVYKLISKGIKKLRIHLN